MHITTFNAAYPDFSLIASPGEFFDSVKADYKKLVDSQFFLKNNEKSIFIYRIESKFSTHIGLIACMNISDYDEGQILKHENTITVKEQQMTELLLQRKAMVKPVLLTYPEVGDLQREIENYIQTADVFYSIDIDQIGEVHTFWDIKDPKVEEKIVALAEAQIPQAYIADGHHRMATTSHLKSHFQNTGYDHFFDHLLVALFPFDQLQVWDYNRIIELELDWSVVAFLAHLSELCDIRVLDEARKPSRKHELTVFIQKEWLSLTWKPEILDKYKDEAVLLDVDLLNQYIFHDVLKITDVRTDDRISYISGKEGLEPIVTKVGKNDNRIGFCLYPLDMLDVKKIADADRVLPPKSTWFEPRMQNGLIVYEF